MDAISIVLGVVGVLGAGGALALFLLAPTVFALIVTRAETVITAVLSTRLGCAAVAGIACFVAADQWRLAADAHACHERIVSIEQQAKAAAEARDTDIRKQIEAEQAPVIAELRKQAEDALGEAQRYEKERLALVAASGGKCVLDAGALRVRNRAQGPPAAAKR